MRNLITDVPGLAVGHAQDARLASGATAIVFDRPAVAAVDVRGGAPGTRETDLLDPGMLVEHIDAIALSGGSAFGLDTASGVQAWLREQGRGFAVGGARVPIVPAAILFDLNNGGDKGWGRYPPYRDLGYAAASAASDDFALGSVGAGLGARTVNLKGGIGSASSACDGCMIGAIAAVNAVGSVVVDDGPWFWAAPFEIGHEFGGRGFPSPLPVGALDPRTKGAVRANTTLVVVATDAALTKSQAKRLAVMAQDGLARAIFPAHTPLDGDLVFAASTGQRALADPVHGLMRLGTCAVQAVARAIARGIYAAAPLPSDPLPSWRDAFGT
ncbi:MAG TPA: P1 family peptidase [Xanthobacteraceae bacterium]|jgi:D-aminopeptidase